MFNNTYAMADVNAMETYLNFTDFIGETDIATEAFNFDWNIFKKKIADFFRHIWQTITTFFTKFFASKEVTLHVKAMNNLHDHVADWTWRIQKAAETFMGSDGTTEDLDKLNYVFYNIKEECQKEVLDRTSAIIGGSKHMYDYKTYKKEDITTMHNFTKKMQKITETAINSKNSTNESYQHKVNNAIVYLTQVLNTVDSAIAKVMIDSQYVNRADGGNEKFDHPITLTNIH